MPIQQGNPVVPPTSTDTKLRDFAQVIQASFLALFQAAHAHKVVSAVPTDREGAIGDIYLLDISGAKKICVKFSDGWYAVAVAKL